MAAIGPITSTASYRARLATATSTYNSAAADYHVMLYQLPKRMADANFPLFPYLAPLLDKDWNMIKDRNISWLEQKLKILGEKQRGIELARTRLEGVLEKMKIEERARKEEGEDDSWWEGFINWEPDGV